MIWITVIICLTTFLSVLTISGGATVRAKMKTDNFKHLLSDMVDIVQEQKETIEALKENYDKEINDNDTN